MFKNMPLLKIQTKFPVQSGLTPAAQGPAGWAGRVWRLPPRGDCFFSFCSVNHQLWGHTASDGCFHCCCRNPGSPILLSLSVPTAGKPQLGSSEACLEIQRLSYELCLPRAQIEGASGSTLLCTSPRAQQGAQGALAMGGWCWIHVWMQTLPWMWLYLVLDKLVTVGVISANCHD